MSPRQLFLLSPYRPPTSYPVSLSTEEANAWLNAYAALWHPAALERAMLPPALASAYDHNDPLPNAVYALPAGPSLFLAEDWKAKAQDANAVWFEAVADRDATMANLFNAAKPERVFEPEFVRACRGLGFGYLMLDTLFDASNHDRLLELEPFWKAVQAAIESQSREPLIEAAKMLLVAREGLTPHGVALSDLIVMKDHALPCALNGRPVTVLTTSHTLKALSGEPIFESLKAENVDLAVGVAMERDDSLLPVESQLWNIRKAREEVMALTGSPPKLWGRLQSEYHPLLPSWLHQFGYCGMLALNLDAAQIPTRYYSVIQWPGPDGKTINAYTRDPHPGDDPATFFNLAYHLHDAQNRESAPCFLMLHQKPAHPAHDDLLALCELAPVFGEFTGLNALTADSHSAEYVSVPEADDFFRDTLDDRITKRSEPRPVSGFAEQVRNRRRLDSAFALAALHHSLTPIGEAEIAKLEAAEDAFERTGHATPLPGLEAHWAQMLADRLQSRSEDNVPGTMVLNPTAATRRVGLELPGTHPIPIEGPVKASEFAGGLSRVVVEVPGLGFAWIPRGVPGTVLPKARIKTAEGMTVRNEYVEAELDPATGAIRAIRDGKFRITRFGQMLVRNPGSRMVASEVTVTASGSVLGEISSRGQILDDTGRPAANFRQIVRAWMGRPALEVRITIEPLIKAEGNPWHDFFGCRFAWRDDRATLFRGMQGQNTVTRSQRPGSPDYLEIRLGKERNFLFTGGLPFLQKKDGRMIDLILAPPGETETNYDIMIAFERDYPMAMAQSWLTASHVVPTKKGPPPVGASGWLANIDMPSLLLTSLRPAPASEGMSRAVEARFLETAGFAAAAELRFARDPAKAYSMDLNGEVSLPLRLKDSAIPIDCSSSELACIKVDFA